MKRCIARHILIARLAALALSVFCLLQLQVRAQGMIGVIVIFPSAGLAPDQSLRLTLFNPNGSPVRAQVRVQHSNGINALFADGSVHAGAFHSFDFKRSDIPLPGEAGTGRIQLSSSVRLTFSEAIKPVAVSMEIVDVTDGTSNTVFVGEVPPSQAGGPQNDTINSGFGNDIMGFVPGQTLRVTLFNPQSPGSDYLPSRVKLFDARGNLIAQSPELVIPPGEFRWIDFDRDALRLPGERLTGRLQVRARLEATTDDTSYIPIQTRTGFIASFGVIDNSTGRTTVLAGQQCLVFYLGGVPGN